MKFKFKCFLCSIFNNEETEYSFIVTDKNIYKLKCDFGHESVISLNTQKFEILFELAVNSYKEDYYRDAILNAVASLERFYEFAIECLLLKENTDENVRLMYSSSFFEDLWKTVKKQSERQVGAFIFLYASNFDEKPPILPNSMVQIRNDVAHNGVFPSKEQAEKYIKEVFNIIQLVTIKLKEYNPRGFNQVYDSNVNKYLLDEDYHYDGNRVKVLEDFIFRVNSQSKEEIQNIIISDKLNKVYSKK